MANKNSVLLIYTGGTIGSVRKNINDPHSPLKPASPDQMLRYLPEIRDGEIYLEETSIKVDVIQTKEVFDSALLKPEYWVELAELIEEHYDNYLGFVILHGTDTMAYTASALAFMIDNLEKPIILTGSQRPIGENRSDAAQNVITAIEIAAAEAIGNTVVPEVCIYFHDSLIRGCRATKNDADGYTGFTSPNYPDLGIAGSNLEIYPELIRQASQRSLKVRKNFDRGVAVLELSPLMSNDLFETVLNADGLSGVILKTYGAGNAPGGRFLDIIHAAIERGVRIVVVTQCHAGTVRLGHYDVSTGLLERGVISGMDMTPEAAQVKLAMLLADSGSLYSVEEMMQINLKGEMDESLFDMVFPGGFAVGVGEAKSEGRFPASKYFNHLNIRKASLRISGLSFVNAENEVKVHLYLNRSGLKAETPRKGSNYIGSRTLFRGDKDDSSIFFDITSVVRKNLEEDKKNNIGIICEGAQEVNWKSMHLAIFA